MKNVLPSLFLLLLSLCLTISVVRGQYAPIPDSTFGNILYNHGYSSCMTGNAVTGYYLDTTCSAVSSNTYFNFGPAGLTDITGVEYFHNISYLNCNGNLLTHITKLPPALQYLLCASNNLTSMPALPSTLLQLNCANNHIATLPTLPRNLNSLKCDTNQLTGLPALPYGLTILSCDSNRLSSLPALPINISNLYLRRNPSLQCLPHIYHSQQAAFFISGSGITCLPDSVTATSYDINPATLPICAGSCGNANIYLAIPDTMLGNWLYTHGYASCMMGGGANGWYQIDTSCSAVMLADTLRCPNINIRNLTGLQYFRHLRYLDCSHNNLDSLIYNLPSSLSYLSCNHNHYMGGLSTLPAALTYFDCNSTSITHLPALPTGLVYLDCGSISVTVIPPLPSTLKYLDCSYDGNTYFSVDSLPVLPAGLTYLDCRSNTLVNFPVTLPAGLQHLNCAENSSLSGGGIYTLPPLPSTLTYLNCASNYLQAIPPLPAALTYFDCSLNNFPNVVNPLQVLPALPTGLKHLDCSANLISTLPSLPPAMTYLNCSENPANTIPAPLPPGLQVLLCNSMGNYLQSLGSLPPLPLYLDSLNCQANAQLTCLPHIYKNSMAAFYILGTGINCVPDRFTAIAYDRRPDTMTVCSPYGGCFSYDIRGNVHNDTSANCLLDSIHPGSALHNIKILLKQNGQVVQQCYADAAVGYIFSLDSLTGYSVDIDTSGLLLSVVCPATGVVSASAADTTGTSVDFGLRCTAEDYGALVVAGAPFKPGDTTIVNVIAGNPLLYWYNASCGAGASGIVTTILTGPVHYAGPAAGALMPSNVSGDTLVYTISNLDSLTLGSLYIRVYTDTLATIGAVVCISAAIQPATPDIYPYDDVSSLCTAVVSSFDPNHKEVSPVNLSENSEWLTYTVRFQNTGNATATNIVVRDTLSQSVLPETFTFIASSHQANVKVVDHAISFDFININLVDSGADQALSQGWLQYKVMSKPNLPVLTQIKNTAYIYFDYNSAIVTNTAVSTVMNINGITSPAENKIHLYPNPNNGSFTLQTSGCINRVYTVSDMLGHIVAQHTMTSDKQTIDLPSLSEGVYTLQMGGSQTLRFAVVK